jgi:hypothetical protein
MLKKVSVLCAGLALAIAAGNASAGLIITGVFDGPLSQGTPKGIELYVTADISDLSAYGVGSANNGGGSDGQEFTLSGSANAGDFIYISTESAGLDSFFGKTADFTTGKSGAAAINGDDAIELFHNGNVIDLFGDINTDGTGEAWEYLDGWAYRNSNSIASPAFDINQWSFSGKNAFDGETTNAAAGTPMPIGTFTASAVPVPAAAWLFGSALLGIAGLRRKK